MVSPIKWVNRRTGKRFLVAMKPNGDVICAGLDKNVNPVSAGNRISRKKFNEILVNLEKEADHNTVDYTFTGGKFVKIERP